MAPAEPGPANKFDPIEEWEVLEESDDDVKIIEVQSSIPWTKLPQLIPSLNPGDRLKVNIIIFNNYKS